MKLRMGVVKRWEAGVLVVRIEGRGTVDSVEMSVLVFEVGNKARGVYKVAYNGLK